MQVFFGIGSLPQSFQGAVVTLGVFDGLHIAHMEIIRRVIRAAREVQTSSLMITFDPHPRKVLQQDRDLQLLTTPKEKLKILDGTDLDGILFLETNKQLLQISDTDFIHDVLIRHIHPKKIVVGYDYHFGKDRGGNGQLLQRLGQEAGYETEIVNPVQLYEHPVRSSLVRKLLRSGNVEQVAAFLGRPYHICGYVVQGSSRGWELGFPTANIAIDSGDKLLPSDGIYLVHLDLQGGMYYGICYIGRRATFNEKKLVIENHILDYPGTDIYGKELEVHFLEKIRNDRKFDSAESLRKQMIKDKEYSLQKIKKYQSTNGGSIQ